MAGKVINVAGAEVVLANGLVTLPTDILRELPMTDYARNGVVLANERIKAFVNHEDGDGAPRPVEYTISIYVQRAPLTDEETAGVHAKALDGDTKKQQRAEETAKERQGAIKSAFELGQSGMLSAMNNIGTLAAAASAIANVKR